MLTLYRLLVVPLPLAPWTSSELVVVQENLPDIPDNRTHIRSVHCLQPVAGIVVSVSAGGILGGGLAVASDWDLLQVRSEAKGRTRTTGVVAGANRKELLIHKFEEDAEPQRKGKCAAESKRADELKLTAKQRPDRGLKRCLPGLLEMTEDVR